MVDTCPDCKNPDGSMNTHAKPDGKPANHAADMAKTHQDMAKQHGKSYPATNAPISEGTGSNATGDRMRPA